MHMSLLILDTIILFVHYNQFIYYLVKRLSHEKFRQHRKFPIHLHVQHIRCLTDNAALRLSKFHSRKLLLLLQKHFGFFFLDTLLRRR